ncbi:MAG: secretin and TonB N-terminal domain-containing protein [bacterium]|nr:secretin and TonB N-terminal domain-containing protein [bacterium]
MTTSNLARIACLLAMALAAAARPPGAGSQPPPAEGSPAPVAEAVPGTVTFNFRDADLRDILRTISYRFGVQIDAGPEVQGRVTLALTDVPWETALGRVLGTCGYGYAKSDGVYRVVALGAEAPAVAAAASPRPTERVAARPTETPLVEEAVPEEIAFERALAERPPTEPGRVTFDFKDADLVNILRIFSVRYGVNIVAGPEVKGKVTIRLTDVPWETALKLILEANNFSYVKTENVIRVLARDQMDKEPLETRVFPLSYSKATEISNSIAHLLTPTRGQVKPDDRSNTVVVTDTPAKLGEIAGIIDRLDRRTAQVLIEARILELRDDFDENIGIDWVALKGYNVRIGPPEGEGFFSVVREDTRTREDATESTARQLDFSRRERQAGTGVFGADDTFGGTASTEYTGTTTTTTSIVDTTGQPSGTRIETVSTTPQRRSADLSGRILEDFYRAEGLDARGSSVTTTELMQAVLTPDNFQLTLNFLQEQTDANLISHPKIVTADNIQAVVKVADQWPIPQFQFNNDTGTWEIQNFEYKDIGIVLRVKPHVNEDDFIGMTVTPEVSNIITFTTFGGAVGAQLPVISTRTAQTDVLVRNGQTLAIGGLIREDESTIVNKLPLFGEIPGLGPYLFSSSSKAIRKSNVLIFITANVVTEDNRDSLWVSQREERDRRLNLPRSKWWEPKRLRYGLGSEAGY